MPADSPDQDPLRVLVITAHPDDVDYGAGGTIAGWTAAGIEVAYCIVTDGDAGGTDAAITRAEMGQLRREEQRKAAAVLGVTEVEFLGYPDGRVMASLELRRDLSRVIRRFRPTRVVVQSPTRDLRSMYASHPDHIATGEAALCAVYPDARNEFAHPELLRDEGLAPHTVAETWVMAPMGDGDRSVDITETVDRKVAALLAHVSQTAHMDNLEALMRGWGARQAQAAGLPEGRLAESFQVLDTR
ncbi:MAG TPA: PIG-L deacetylase family protein [Sporichthya sp.]|nr:PIG-L deacetylase family protein [Sporichthya sp.]